MNKLWIRDSNGQPLEIRDVWIRSQGQARKISDIWIRNASGVAVSVYPNVEEETTTIIIFNQGTDQQLLSLRFDQKYNNNVPVQSLNIESSYRNLGVKFGMNTGVGSSGGSETIITHAQNAFTGVISSWQNKVSTNPTTSFNWDWGPSINIENYPSVEAILRGGKDSNVQVPLNYIFLKRDNPNNIDTATQQVINTVLHYYPNATSSTITYHQLHDSCLKANNDVAVWLKQQIPDAKIANWWKTSTSPVPLIGVGWWNNNNPVSLDSDGTPPFGLNHSYQQAVEGLRTINGHVLHREVGTTVSIPDPLPTWTYGMGAYPYGTYQARANAVAFEKCSNSAGIQNNVDVVVHQSYFPVYSIERTLDLIHPNGYTSIDSFALTNGWSSDGSRYCNYPDAMDSTYKANRINWFANWKRFGTKASVGTELCFDFGGFDDHRFNGLATDVFDYKTIYVDAILDKVTQEEATLYSLPSETIGKRLIPNYWSFWTAAYYYLDQLMSWVSSGISYHGRGPFSASLPNPSCTGSCVANPDALTRSRANIEWRFAGMPNAPQIDWFEGSNWHGFICRQLDLFGIERCELVKDEIEIARQDN